MTIQVVHLKSKLLRIFAATTVLIVLSYANVSAKQLMAAVVTGDLPRYHQAHEAFEKIVRAGGFDESKLQIFAQYPNPDKMSLTNSLRRSIAAGADLIITYGAMSTAIAADMVEDVPVLFADVYDPLGLGIVNNLAAPGVNRSGAASQVPLDRMFNAMGPILSGKRIGVIYSESDPGARRQLADLEKNCQLAGSELVKVNLRNTRDLDGDLKTLPNRTDLLFVADAALVASVSDRIMEFAGSAKLPVISQIPGLAGQGALATLEPDPEEQGKVLGVHALQLLAGQQAFMLPVRVGKTAKLMVNRSVAGKLGITLPKSLLEAADEVLY
ncbi:MAG: hypothetical protein C0616_08305 [Desulfuromonas sp.]|nr:MAG: hypothetical protein C0616_08305 [Desulfuromonas sp.]